VPEVDLEAPSLDVEVPEVDLEAPSLEVKAPEVDLEAPALDVEVPEVDLEAPSLDVEVPEVDLEAPSLKVWVPKVDLEAPALGVEAPEVEPVAEAPIVPPEPDDLKLIEGIGPKISSVLKAAGVVTFAQLANTEVSQIQQILEDADPRLLRLAKPSTWPEQAGLAAAGDWEELEKLQGELTGGRRT
jgi:predicted flap endonuclease-1-like 5' DNA nuclease